MHAKGSEDIKGQKKAKERIVGRKLAKNASETCPNYSVAGKVLMHFYIG